MFCQARWGELASHVARLCRGDNLSCGPDIDDFEANKSFISRRAFQAFDDNAFVRSHIVKIAFVFHYTCRWYGKMAHDFHCHRSNIFLSARARR